MRFQTTTINRNGMTNVTTGYRDPYGNQTAYTYDNYGLKSISQTKTNGGMFPCMGGGSFADSFAQKYLGLKGNYFGDSLGFGGLGLGGLSGLGGLDELGLGGLGLGGIRDMMDMLQMRRLRNSLGLNRSLPMAALGLPEGYEHSYAAGNRHGDYVRSNTEQTTSSKIKDYVGIAKELGLVDYFKDNVLNSKKEKKKEKIEERYVEKIEKANEDYMKQIEKLA